MGVIIKNNRMYTGGSGGYSEFTLWEDSSGASPSSAVTLADNISKYDAIYIVSASNAEPNYRNSQIIPVSAIDKTGSTNFGVFDTGANYYYYSVLNYVDDTHLTLGNWGSSYPIKYYKIVGIKYRGDAELHEYSTIEHIVGTWIDGSILYEKTLTFTISSTVTTLLTDNSIKLVNAKGVASKDNAGTKNLIFPYYDAGNDYMMIQQNNGTIAFYCTNWFISNTPNITATIQYTKTTS